MQRAANRKLQRKYYCFSDLLPRTSGVDLLLMPRTEEQLRRASEPERSSLAEALRMLKQTSSRILRDRAGDRAFWQKRYYDFNVFSDHKRIEKLRYMRVPGAPGLGAPGSDRNPVKRGLVEKPEDWKWSSYRHYLTGAEGVVEIESEWTAAKRERMGIVPKLKT